MAGSTIAQTQGGNMKSRTFILVFCLSLLATLVSAQNLWTDFSTGATQPFRNSTGQTGTVSYTDTFQSVSTDSRNSPSNNFPFSNPIDYLAVYQIGNASIDFTFSGVSPDSQSIFTLGNLRPGNRFLVSAFDASNNPISLTTWTTYGDYLLYATDDAPNLWNASTGEMSETASIRITVKTCFLA